MIDLKGQAAPDGSFGLTDEAGGSWKGRFVSGVLITGVAVNPIISIGHKADNDCPMRLRMLRDATPDVLLPPLPPTTSDWSAFLADFKNAVKRRDAGVLTRVMSRNFGYFQYGAPANALTYLKWDEVDRTLALKPWTSRIAWPPADPDVFLWKITLVQAAGRGLR